MRSMCVVVTAILLAAPAASAQEEPREATPRGSRPQGDNPQTGTAVPRGSAPREAAPPPPSSRRSDGERVNSYRSSGRTVIVQPPPVYGYPYPPYSTYPPYGAYPYGGYRRQYPYGYGSFGMGFLYYDPYRWHPGAGYVDPYRRFNSYSTFDIGELRLDVSPRQAQVYVDGYFAGTVDDFDGAFQAIKLAPGAYRIDIVAPGYAPLTADVHIAPGQKVRYRGELLRHP